MDNKLSDEQKKAQDEMLKRADAFEVLVKQKGWEYVKAYYQNEIQAFVNGLLIGDDKSIEVFEAKRRELIGVRKLIGSINSDLDALKRFREQNGTKD